MLSEPTIAKYTKVEGYATSMSVLLRVSAVIGKSVGSVKLSIVIPSRSQQVQIQTSKEDRKVQFKRFMIFAIDYCDLSCHVMMIVKMTVSVADVHGAGSVRTKLRPVYRGRKRGKLPVICVYFCLIFPAQTQSTG